MKTAYLTPVAIAAAFAALSGNALAQTAAPAAAPAAAKAPEPDYTLSGNLGIFSDYRFRGVSQTNKLPAIQGGVDLALKNGLYLGNWNSNVDSTMYNGASIEMDFYGGYKATFGDFGLDVGGIYYYYPGTGAAYETGTGRGRGATLNCPMPAGATDIAQLTITLQGANDNPVAADDVGAVEHVVEALAADEARRAPVAVPRAAGCSVSGLGTPRTAAHRPVGHRASHRRGRALSGRGRAGVSG